MKTKYVLKNKKRFYTFLSTVLFVTIMIAFAGNVYGYKQPSYKTIIVKKGDTLWDIANANTHVKNADTRKLVYQIKKSNRLASSEIYEGTELIIPTK